MLTGSQSKKVKGLGLHKLSTFGLLRPLKQTDAVELIDWLLDSGYLKQIETTKFRPVTQISESGRSAMSSQVIEKVWVRMPGSLVASISKTLPGRKPKFSSEVEMKAAEVPSDVEIQTAKVALQDDVESEFESVSESPEQEIAAELTELREDIALAGSNSSSESADAEVSTRKTRVDASDSGTVKPSYYWTWKLMQDGYDIGQVRQVRQIDDATVCEHLIIATENELRAEVDWVLTSGQIEELCQFVHDNPESSRAVLLSRLPAGFNAHQLIYYLNATAANV